MNLSSFSDGYYVADGIRVGSHDGDSALMYHDTYQRLQRAVGEPVVLSICSETWEPHASTAVPTDFVSIPKSDEKPAGDEPVLVQKPDRRPGFL